MATTIPADVAILSHPDFVEARHSTKWVEDALDLLGPRAGDTGAVGAEPTATSRGAARGDGRGRRPPLPPSSSGCPTAAGAAAAATGRAGATSAGRPTAAAVGAGSGSVTVPMQGTIVKVLVAVGDTVEVGQTICVLEAMKMENAVNAEKAGVVREVRVAAGDSVGGGDVVAVIE